MIDNGTAGSVARIRIQSAWMDRVVDWPMWLPKKASLTTRADGKAARGWTRGRRSLVILLVIDISAASLRMGQVHRGTALLRESLDLCLALRSMSSLTLVLSGAANLARGRGETALCVRLHAAASGIRERLKMVRPPDVQQSMARELEQAREMCFPTVGLI